MTRRGPGCIGAHFSSIPRKACWSRRSFYALSAAFFLGVFLIKYRIEFLLCMPFLALLFAWYLVIGMRAQSPAQHPERLYRERSFLAYVGLLGVLITLLFFIDLPWLDILVESDVIAPR
jgi:decaprenyl-phosphate phosphoribosyltransferase